MLKIGHINREVKSHTGYRISVGGLRKYGGKCMPFERLGKGQRWVANVS